VPLLFLWAFVACSRVTFTYLLQNDWLGFAEMCVDAMDCAGPFECRVQGTVYSVSGPGACYYL